MHTQVISSVPGKYKSKWGEYPLISHSPTQVPYSNPYNRMYFVRPCTSSPAITRFIMNGYTDAMSSLSFCPNETNTVRPYFALACGTVLEGQWQASGCTVVESGKDYISVIAPSGLYAHFTVNYRYRNACGWSSWSTMSGSTRNCDAGEDPYRIAFSVSQDSNNNIIYIQAEQENLTLRSSVVNEIRLYNSNGGLVHNIKSDNKNVEINTSKLPNGLYFINIYSSNADMPYRQTIYIKH
jgi:hypothetical protein